jgi:chromosome segregation ATPase
MVKKDGLYQNDNRQRLSPDAPDVQWNDDAKANALAEIEQLKQNLKDSEIGLNALKYHADKVAKEKEELIQENESLMNDRNVLQGQVDDLHEENGSLTITNETQRVLLDNTVRTLDPKTINHFIKWIRANNPSDYESQRNVWNLINTRNGNTAIINHILMLFQCYLDDMKRGKVV